MRFIIFAAAACAAALVPAASQAQRMSCEDLYVARNAIYQRAGYCFHTARALRTFSNDGCLYDDVRSVPLSDFARQQAGALLRREHALGCPE